MSGTIILPRTTKDGKPRISYSQFTSWQRETSYNWGVEGKIEYIAEYFLGKTFPDSGYSQFGKEVEGYVCERKYEEKFSDKEKEVLNTIKPLGKFQEEFEIDFGEFVFTGIIDDRTEDWGVLRDYKTGSKKSVGKYYEEEYLQLDFYAMKAYEITGILPKLEVCIIERKGSCMWGGGRQALTVGENVWYVVRETSIERLETLKKELFKVVAEISDYYKLFLEFSKNGSL